MVARGLFSVAVESDTSCVTQVLAIVLGNSNSGTSSGLFFPEGVAGSNPMFTSVS